MKKHIGILFCITIIFSFAGCNKTEKATTSSDFSNQSLTSASTETSSTAHAVISDMTSETSSISPANSFNSSSKKTSEFTSSRNSSKGSSQQSSVSTSLLTRFSEGNITFKLPSSYKKLSESPIIYVPADYPQVSDNFNITITEKNPAFREITKELYQQQLETMFSSINITEFKNTTVSGFSAIKICCSISYNGVSMEQAQFLVDGDKMYTFSYTFVNGDLKNYFNDCVESISINK